jgi:pectate lyase
LVKQADLRANRQLLSFYLLQELRLLVFFILRRRAMQRYLFTFSKVLVWLLIALPVACQDCSAQVPAFPGAEGYGSLTRGGRGGQLIAVTNLNDSGPGSLRDAVDTKGPRNVVFRVSGTIPLKSRLTIRHPFITIAGQTAPGDGICLRGYPLSIDADEVIIRYLRVRFGNESGSAEDAVSGRYHKNIILDHLSASWSVDECLSVYHCENVTVQWCLMSESLFGSVHGKWTHGFGGIWGGDQCTYHHNLLAHHSSRNPRFASASGHTDFRNNVIYNWGYNSTYGGEKVQPGRPQFKPTVLNVVANYYKPGPATKGGEIRHRIAEPSTRNGVEDVGKWYVAENVMVGDPAVTAANWNGGVKLGKELADHVEALRLEKPWPAVPIRQQTAAEAYESVLQGAGATLPRRDAVDARVIDETWRGVATYEGKTYKEKVRVDDPSQPCGIIDSQADVGGWPELKSLPAPADSDGDGMPDEWELRFEFDPQGAADGAQDKDEDGYTNLEEYLNGTDPTVFVDYTKPENNINMLK